MTDREGATANKVPDLGRAIASQLAHVDLREALRKQLQLSAFQTRVGWPRTAHSARLAASPIGASWGARTLVLLEAVPSGAACGVSLHNDQASALVDRILGGPGKLGVPGKLGALSDPECGVLAYFAARCAAALRRFRLLDVMGVEGSALAPFLGQDVIAWPLQLASQELTLDLTLLLTHEPCAESYRVEVVVADGLEEGALAGLQAGDLLVSEQWPMLVTTRGLEATVELRVAGSDERLMAVVQGDSLRASGVTQHVTGKRGELVLGSLELTFAELAALASGETRVLAAGTLDKAALWMGERAIARGSLVHYERAVALRVDELAPYSTR